MIRILASLVIAGVVAGNSASARGESFDRPGPPTRLAPGETPLEAVCKLRAKFEALPEPIHNGFRHHPQRVTWKFAVGKSVSGPYTEIIPTKATRAFVTSHSRLELVAALAPYVTDPDYAGKAVAVLASLPPGEKGYLTFTQGFANLVQENGTGRTSWDETQRRRARINLPSVYGLFSATGHSAASKEGTLEAAIAPVLSALQSMPAVMPAIDLTDQKRYPTFEAALAAAPVPEVDPKLRAFIQRWPREWLVTALFPFSLRDDPFRASPREILPWVMGREAAYWPFSAPAGFSKVKQVAAYEEEVARYARGLCPGKPR